MPTEMSGDRENEADNEYSFPGESPFDIIDIIIKINIIKRRQELDHPSRCSESSHSQRPTTMHPIHPPTSPYSPVSALLLRLAHLENLLSPVPNIDTTTNDDDNTRPGQDILSRTETLERRLNDLIRASGHEGLRKFVDQCELATSLFRWLVTSVHSACFFGVRGTRLIGR